MDITAPSKSSPTTARTSACVRAADGTLPHRSRGRNSFTTKYAKIHEAKPFVALRVLCGLCFSGGPLMPGYSGTPLPKKLGIRDGFRVHFVEAPAEVVAD